MKIKNFLDMLNFLDIMSKQKKHRVIILDFESKKILSSKDEKYYKLLDKNILNCTEIKAKNINYYVITPEM